MKLRGIILFSLLFYTTSSFAENYSFGIMPTNRKSDDAITSYSEWKNRFVTSEGAGGYQRVKNDSGETVSEGIGYGMLLAVFSDDKLLFNNLWNYYKLHLDPNGLMNWKIDSFGNTTGQNAATDADQDVAFALIMAHYRWNSKGDINYLSAAKDMINKIYLYEIEAGTYVLKPGDVWGGSDVTNLSYFSPAYYRIFQGVTGNTEWSKVISKNYEILIKSANASTGLVPDWCDVNGNKVSDANISKYGQTFSYQYGYDAVRTPWRIALDYLWFGEQKANDFSKKIVNFVKNTIGIGNVKDGYLLDGTKTGQWHNSPFISTFAVAAMAVDSSYQSFCDEGYTESVNTSGDNYYNMSIRTLMLFVQNGKFYLYYLLGDIDYNGETDLADVISALRICSEIYPSALIYKADVDGDGRISLSEAIYIIQIVAGLR